MMRKDPVNMPLPACALQYICGRPLTGKPDVLLKTFRVSQQKFNLRRFEVVLKHCIENIHLSADIKSN